MASCSIGVHLEVADGAEPPAGPAAEGTGAVMAAVTPQLPPAGPCADKATWRLPALAWFGLVPGGRQPVARY